MQVAPAPALRLVSDWHDVGRRFLSALWHWIEDHPNDAYDGPDFTLSTGDFPDSDHWEIFRALVGNLNVNLRSTPETVREIARGLGATLPSLDGFDEVDRVRWAESTSAGLVNYAAILRDHGRRRALVAGLHKAIEAVDDVFTPTRDLLDRVAELVGRIRRDQHESPAPPSCSRNTIVISSPVAARPTRRRRRSA